MASSALGDTLVSSATQKVGANALETGKSVKALGTLTKFGITNQVINDIIGEGADSHLSKVPEGLKPFSECKTAILGGNEILQKDSPLNLANNLVMGVNLVKGTN